MSGVQLKTVTKDEDGIRLDRWFKKNFPGLPFAMLSKLLRNGNIRVDGKRAKVDTRIPEGAVVRVPPLGEQPEAPEPKPVVVKPEDVELLKSMILYEDEDVIVLNKVPGLAVQGGTGTTRHIDGMLDGLAVDGVRPRLVHRLDRDTSGVLILAKNGQSAAALGKSFHSRSAKKLYWAVVIGRPEISDGVIKAPLAKEAGARGERMEVNSDEGKHAITKFHVMDSAGAKCAWLALMPLTGRTHQLRAHCAYMGTPIVGDGKYGATEAYLTGTVSRKLHLHARRLIVPHPKRPNQVIDVMAPLPDHMLETWKTFDFDPNDRSMPFVEKK